MLLETYNMIHVTLSLNPNFSLEDLKDILINATKRIKKVT